MAIGIVNNEEFEKELNKYIGNGSVPDSNASRAVHPEKVIDINRGRGNTKEVPESIRKMIAEESICGASGKELIGAFGISQSSISAYKEGATSTATINEPDKNLKEHVESVKIEIGSHARGRLMAALQALDDEKIMKSKAKDISSIAKDMSSVMKNMEPSGPLVQNNQQVIVYRPRMKEEEDYKIIEVTE